MSGYTRCYVNDKLILVHSPSIHIAYEAEEIYAQTYRNCYGVMEDYESIMLLEKLGLWDEETQKKYEILPKHIEQFQMDLYRAYFNTNQQEKIRKYLDKAKSEYESICELRSKYFHMTRTGVALFAKYIFLIEQCSTYSDFTLCDWDDVSLQKVSVEYQKHGISDKQLRELSRTDPWMSIWRSNQINGKVFDQDLLNIEQRRLIQWSSLYDNIREAMEPPPSGVYDDDDMIDGWLAIQHKQRNEEESKQSVEGKFAHNKRIAEAGEVYIPVGNVKDAQRVNAANDGHAQAIKKQRFNKINQLGRVHEHQLDDKKLERQMQQNQAYSNAMKKTGG